LEIFCIAAFCVIPAHHPDKRLALFLHRHMGSYGHDAPRRRTRPAYLRTSV